MRKIQLILAAAALALAGCSSYSMSDVEKRDAATQEAKVQKTDPAKIIVTEGDITDRKYVVLADITATVNKTTIFHADPTPALVEKKLREDAAELGADAVVLTRYGDVGVSLLSWGSLEGKGRAVRFVE